MGHDSSTPGVTHLKSGYNYTEETARRRHELTQLAALRTSVLTRLILRVFGRRLNREVFFPAVSCAALDKRTWHTVHHQFDPTQSGLVGIARTLPLFHNRQVLRFAGVLAALFLFASTARADSINLINNGDFAQGNVGFETDYRYVGHDAMSLWPEGVYTIADDLGAMHPLWTNTGDATGDGNLMFVNGRTTPSTVWFQSVATDIGQSYLVEAFVENLCCINEDPSYRLPALEFWINGVLFGQLFTDGPGVWVPFSQSYAALQATTTLEIRNAGVDYSGNDAGIDGIAMTPTPEPASIVLLLTGLGAAVVRRRRNARV